MAKYGYVVDTLLPMFDNNSSIFSKAGAQTYEETREQIELMEPFQVFNLAINLLNNFPTINPLLDSITESGADQIITEIFMEGEFQKSTDMAKGKGAKPVQRSIAIPVDNYDYAINCDWVAYERNPFGYIDKMIQSVVESYQKKITNLAMIALVTKPTATNDPKVPGFYFDTSAWDADKQIIPYPNGNKRFDATEDHYLYYTEYSEDILFDLRKILTVKGYGKNGVDYFATESTWREFQKLSDWSSETKHMFELNDGFFNGRKGNRYITLTDGELDDGYVICLDTTKKIIYKREDNNPKFKGLFTKFGAMSAKNAIPRADFKVLNTGWGVQDRGAGSIAYIKAGASEYVNPAMYS